VSTLDERHKNIRGTLEAFARLKEARIDFEFVIITDGDRRLAVETAEGLGLEDRIRIEGPASPEEIAREMAISDALILFSNTENQPCVILESLAVGLPVIASTVGDIPNLVTHNRGILVEPGNVEDLAEGLLKFANGEVGFRRELVAEGVYETFSFEAVCKRYTAHYEEVLGRR
jgi:glycosyltransferase involved in cell wall biosynthesis